MRKSGAKHSTIAVRPFGAKTSDFEMAARAALVALKADCANEQHLVNLYVLAEMCEALNLTQERHVVSHCASIKRLCNAIHADGYYSGCLATTSMTASVDVLLKWFHTQPNLKIAQVAKRKVKELKNGYSR